MNNDFNFASSDMVHVDSYTRSNGTFVEEYWRRKPNGIGQSIVPQTENTSVVQLLDLFPFAEQKYNKNNLLKKLLSKQSSWPQPIAEEHDENSPHTVFIPEYKGGLTREVGIFEGAGELLAKGVEVVKEAAIKAGEIAVEAAKKTGEAVVNTAKNVGNVFVDAPKELIVDTTRQVLQGGVEISEYIEPAIETVKSGVLDTVKEAISKIDTDEVALLLTNVVKKFGDIVQKYPELEDAYEKLQTMRVNATVYITLERQKIFEGAKEAKNKALIAAKDFGNEIKNLSAKASVIKNTGNSTSYGINNAGNFENALLNTGNMNLPNINVGPVYRRPSILDIKTPAADFWTNPYYMNIEPLQNRVHVNNFSGRVYKTPAQVAKEMKGYAHFRPDWQMEVVKNVDIPVFKYADEYYRIALNGVTNVGKTNVAYKLYEVPDKELLQFIKQHYKVSENIDVVTPTIDSEIRDDILQSQYFADSLRLAIDKIGIKNMPKNTSIEFPKIYNIRDLDLYATFHFAEIYDPYYDFAKTNADIFSEVLINNAYVQQELGMMKNYVIIIPIILKVQ